MLVLSLLGAAFSSICLGKEVPQHRVRTLFLKVTGRGYCSLLRRKRERSLELWLISYFILWTLAVVVKEADISVFCPLATSMAQKVVQTQASISVMETKTVAMDCVYETRDSSYYLFWYKQTASGEMVFLIRQDSYNKENATEGRYSLNFQMSKSSIGLIIRATQIEDSAVYFCAMSEGTVAEASKRAPQKPQPETKVLRIYSTDRKRQGLW